MAKIGVQLYSVRDQCARNYDDTLRQIADMGYAGVELAGMYGESPLATAKLLDQLGLKIPSMHAGLPMLDKMQETLDLASIFGVERIVCAWYPPEAFTSRTEIMRVCDELNEASGRIQADSRHLYYHNHWQEFASVDGKPVYKYMLEYLDPSIGFEPDVYWIKTAGYDPAAIVRELGTRAPLLHIKDGPATMDGDMTAVGSGVVDMRAIAEASKNTADWWIVELDRCATDMLTALRESINYLKQNGLPYAK